MFFVFLLFAAIPSVLRCSSTEHDKHDHAIAQFLPKNIHQAKAAYHVDPVQSDHAVDTLQPKTQPTHRIIFPSDIALTADDILNLNKHKLIAQEFITSDGSTVWVFIGFESQDGKTQTYFDSKFPNLSRKD